MLEQEVVVVRAADLRGHRLEHHFAPLDTLVVALLGVLLVLWGSTVKREAQSAKGDSINDPGKLQKKLQKQVLEHGSCSIELLV